MIHFSYRLIIDKTIAIYLMYLFRNHLLLRKISILTFYRRMQIDEVRDNILKHSEIISCKIMFNDIEMYHVKATSSPLQIALINFKIIFGQPTRILNELPQKPQNQLIKVFRQFVDQGCC